MAGTEPKYWFLPNLPYTEGNEVVPLVDGADCMKHLHDRLLLMGADDVVFYTAWRASPSQRLRPDLPDSDSRLQSLFLDLVKRGVVVRILAWYVFTSSLMPWYQPLSWVVSGHVPLLLRHPKEQHAFIESVRKAIATKRMSGGAFLDARLPPRGSHHQKSMVLTSGGDQWAYVGGIDLALDRWDTPAHSGPSMRQREFLPAWHDVHCAIRGQAVKEIWRNFKDRWNDPTPPVSGFGPWANERPEPIRTELKVPAVSKGTINVQRLRTLACGVYSFQKHGEKTSLHGINRAIDQAQHYIYIEDQYLWPCTTIDHLARAIRDRQVHVFLVLAKQYDMPGPFSIAHYEMRQSVLAELRKAGHDKLTCCHLEQLGSSEQIYVHSKFMIVDDRFVAIGSTNVGLRSHTTDSELHVSLLDDTLVDSMMNGATFRACKLAKELRIRVWKEHLNVEEAALEDPILAKARWPRQGGSGRPSKVHHAVYHSGDIPPPSATLADWYRAIKAIQDFLRLLQPLPNVTEAEKTLVDKAVNVFEKLAEPVLQFSKEDLVLGPVWWTPKFGLKYRLIEFVKNKIMNIETRCDF